MRLANFLDIASVTCGLEFLQNFWSLRVDIQLLRNCPAWRVHCCIKIVHLAWQRDLVMVYPNLTGLFMQSKEVLFVQRELWLVVVTHYIIREVLLHCFGTLK